MAAQGGRRTSCLAQSIMEVRTSPKPPKQFYRRQLPETCVSFSSEEGRSLFQEALTAGYMRCYFNLAAQFRTQDEPAFCGLSTLVMALNALNVDPKKVWKGPWRWYHEDMLDCCLPLEVIKQNGITLEQFTCLARCNTLDVHTVRAVDTLPEEEFRNVVKCIAQQDEQVLVATYSRQFLKQTGDGHFSPIAGYHPGQDMVLILDTARFKYPPHWVKLPLLVSAMQALDKQTGLPRGYVFLKKSLNFPLILFRVSEYLNITISEVSTLGEGAAAMLSNYLEWLNTENDGKTNDDIIKMATTKLNSLLTTLNQNDVILTTQMDISKKDISEDHRCAIKELVEAVEKLPMFNQIKTILNREEVRVLNKTGGKFGKVTSDVVPCCDKDETCSALKSLSQEHFLTVLLLSLPYKTDTDRSLANSLAQMRSGLLQDCPEVLQNEVGLLQKQLKTVLGYIKRCQDCCCKR